MADGRAKPRNQWFCPVCGSSLAYGVYCRACKVEASFAWRPPADPDRALIEIVSLLIRLLPDKIEAPEYPAARLVEEGATDGTSTRP